jgi:hypothetical protein
MLRRWLAPDWRGTFLVMLGATLVSVALTIGVVTQKAAPVAVSAPEPVAPTGSTPVGDTPPVDPTPTRGAPPSSSSTTSPPATPTPTSPPTSAPMSTRQAAPPDGDEPVMDFRAVAGPACPVNSTRDVRVSAGWQVVPGDSWTGDGCGDRFLYSSPDDPNYVQWRFAFEAAGERRCRISVFVPDSPLASAKVWYGVADRFEDDGYRVGGFTVDQKAGRGRWVSAGTVFVGTAALLVNVEGDQGLTGVTAGALRVACEVTGR